MKLTIIGLVLALCCMGMAVVPSPRAAAHVDTARSLAVGDLAPDWTLSDAQGKTHSLADYRGKIIVLDFWASWCSKCAKLMPKLEKLHQKYKDRGVVVLGVNSFETGDPVTAMNKNRLTYKLLLKGEDIAAAYGITTVPAIYVIGVDGKVLYFQAGVEDHGLTDLIEKALQERES
jgi:peroxiredoxin